MTTGLILDVLRFLSAAGAILTHCCFIHFCSDLARLPPLLLQRLQDPAFCSAQRRVAFLSADQMGRGTHSRIDLGKKACSSLRDRVSETNTYRLLGQRSTIVLEGKQPRFLVAKAHHRLDSQEEWAKKMSACLFIHKNCSSVDVLRTLNPSMPRCHSVALSKVLERRAAEHSEGAAMDIIELLHPALALLETFTGNEESWPFARYVGGCGIFAVSEYKGCTLTNFRHFPMIIKVSNRSFSVINFPFPRTCITTNVFHLNPFL